MSKPYTIIQCSNYFEYIELKARFKTYNYQVQYFDNTYTFKCTSIHFNSIPSFIKQYAPTSKLTQVSFRNGRATYIKLKD